MEREMGRQPVSDPSRSPFLGYSPGNLEREPYAVFQAAPIVVSPAVGSIQQELVKQVTVRPVDLHTIKARLPGILRAFSELVYYIRDLLR